jgi:plastocyanin
MSLQNVPPATVLASVLLGTVTRLCAADLSLQVLDRSGRPLPDAVVLLDSSLPGARPLAKAEYLIAEEKMKFVPAVSVVPVGAKVVFSNLDRWDHHVRGGQMGPGGVYLDPSQGFAMRLAGRVDGKAPSSASQAFVQPGPQLLGCHLHGSMRGHVYVSDSPWAAVSDAEGRLSFSGLPDGAAKLRVWHPDQLLDGQVQSIQLNAGANSLSLPTQIAPRRAAAAPGAQPY